MDMSTPLLPEVIPEIDANPMTFLGASGEGEGKCKRVGEVIRQSEQLLNFLMCDSINCYFKLSGKYEAVRQMLAVCVWKQHRSV